MIVWGRGFQTQISWPVIRKVAQNVVENTVSGLSLLSLNGVIQAWDLCSGCFLQYFQGSAIWHGNVIQWKLSAQSNIHQVHCTHSLPVSVHFDFICATDCVRRQEAEMAEKRRLSCWQGNIRKNADNFGHGFCGSRADAPCSSWSNCED